MLSVWWRVKDGFCCGLDLLSRPRRLQPVQAALYSAVAAGSRRVHAAYCRNEISGIAGAVRAVSVSHRM